MLSYNQKIDGLEIAIIGGSGFYNIKNVIKRNIIETPFGPPSAPITIAEVNGRLAAFLPRHGENHEYPPHKINYKANIWALKQLGTRRIISTGAVGCLNANWNIGEIVICDQFVNRTWNRLDTYYDGPITTHISASDPYCNELRDILIKTGQELQLKVREKGILLVIQGPRFSTRAENRDWSRAGYDLISMTHYPEVVLAKELDMCYSSVCIVTDYANILDAPQTVDDKAGHKDVVEVYTKYLDDLIKLIEYAVPKIPTKRSCLCSFALAAARADGHGFNENNLTSNDYECREEKLRYGHNPHQEAKWVVHGDINSPTVSLTEIGDMSNSKLSLTDLQNIDKATRVLKYQKQTTIVIVKHALITGAAYGNDPLDNIYLKAYTADTAAARTGTVVVKGKIDTDFARTLLNTQYDIIAATEWEPKAKDLLLECNSSGESNLRLIKINNIEKLPTYIGDETKYFEKHTFNDGSYVDEKPFLSRIKSIDDFSIFSNHLRIFTTEEKEDLLFAWYLTINSRTNSAVIIKDRHVLSVSAGNQDGISAIELAIFRAKSRYRGKSSINNCIIATDGNFPFEYPVKLLAESDIGTIIMPGGANNDEQVIREFNLHGISVVFTKERCFCHF